MSAYEITRPKPDLIRMAFGEAWDARAHSEAMFRALLAALDDSETEVTLLIVAGPHRPIYENRALQPARAILHHDNLKRMVVVSPDAQQAVTHMGATRAEHGAPPIPMLAFDSEAAALAAL